ncbi:MAG: peptide deformylase [Candidatus Eremiobacteraeota bacterium]|nr:peptide deformylase [Candidatus Eremiobacteraeota bacterium]
MPYVRQIIHDGHPTLRKIAKKVKPEELDDPLFQQLIDDMFVTMYEAPGIGLAAPQIDVSKRLFTIDLQDEGDESHGPFVIINPKFVETRGEMESLEGCLSVPGFVGEITRYEFVAVSGLDRNGRKIRLEGDGLFARCLQHEIDHLNGVLYIDKAKNMRPAQTEEEQEAAEGGQSDTNAIDHDAEEVEAGAAR